MYTAPAATTFTHDAESYHNYVLWSRVHGVWWCVTTTLIHECRTAWTEVVKVRLGPTLRLPHPDVKASSREPPPHTPHPPAPRLPAPSPTMMILPPKPINKSPCPCGPTPVRSQPQLNPWPKPQAMQVHRTPRSSQAPKALPQTRRRPTSSRFHLSEQG